MAEVLDLTGHTYGRLTVTERAPDYISPSGNRARRWRCTCQCGETIVAKVDNLRMGATRSCGCIRREVTAATNAATKRLQAPGYASMHARLRRERGKAADHDCVDCLAPAVHWSYDHQDPAEQIEELEMWGTLRPVAYSTDVRHYEPRCLSCHRAFDARRGVLSKTKETA